MLYLPMNCHADPLGQEQLLTQKILRKPFVHPTTCGQHLGHRKGVKAVAQANTVEDGTEVDCAKVPLVLHGCVLLSLGDASR